MQKEPPSPTPFSPEDDRARESTLNATLSKFTDFSGRGKEGAGFSPRNQLSLYVFSRAVFIGSPVHRRESMKQSRSFVGMDVHKQRGATSIPHASRRKRRRSSSDYPRKSAILPGRHR
jgi:hypothetical protein